MIFLSRVFVLGFLVVQLASVPGFCQSPPQNGGTESDKRLDALEASARRFVESYNQGSAKGVADTYLPDAELILSDGTQLVGREAIAAFYEDLFASFDTDSRPQAAIEVGAVHFVTPGVAIESGNLHLTDAAGVVTTISYKAVQIQQADESWLTGSVRDESEGPNDPANRLEDLAWIVGDWVIQNNGLETLLSFDWSGFGPYIDGRADMIQTLEGNRVGIEFRIGWDQGRKGFISWSHDSAGGFVRSEWTRTDDGTWLIRSEGTTADGEANRYTQICTVETNREGFTWEIKDQTIGGEPQPDRSLKAVKLPPAPGLSASEPSKQ
ncbi:MAG: SgcJ/EcaC family oxidoreductase [Verrucomicrobiae bacterium]|nr:SgcJ/EcaC family oxidoreductase [Verrucomicrobiae bacterium]